MTSPVIEPRPGRTSRFVVYRPDEPRPGLRFRINEEGEPDGHYMIASTEELGEIVREGADHLGLHVGPRGEVERLRAELAEARGLAERSARGGTVLVGPLPWERGRAEPVRKGERWEGAKRAADRIAAKMAGAFDR